MIPCAHPAAQFESRRDDIEAAVLRVLRSGHYILGPEVEALEHEFAEYIGVSHAVGVASGTDAVELGLRALGIGCGDEVITVSQTAVATVAAIEATGASAVLLDVDPAYYTLDPAGLESVLTSRTRAVVAVHLYGQPADVDAIASFCATHHLAFVEDCAQAHGAEWRGRRLGSFGMVGCFSCYPTKNLGALGDAGLITTNDAAIADRIRMLRQYGWRERYCSEVPGKNSRLDEVQAAILRVKLRFLDADNARRRQIARAYATQLTALPLVVPKVRPFGEHVFHLYVVRLERRDEVLRGLSERGISPGIHYPVPVHRQDAYVGRVRTAPTMSVTEMLARHGMSLPLYPELSENDVAAIVSALEQTLATSTCGMMAGVTL